MTSYTARQLRSLHQIDGVLATTAHIRVEEVEDPTLQAAWAETRLFAVVIMAALRETSRMMRELPEDRGTIELERGIRAEGSLAALLVYYGFDPDVIENDDLHDVVMDVMGASADFRVAAHRLDGLLAKAGSSGR